MKRDAAHINGCLLRYSSVTPNKHPIMTSVQQCLDTTTVHPSFYERRTVRRVGAIVPRYTVVPMFCEVDNLLPVCTP